jgi:hypothetical protein
MRWEIKPPKQKPLISITTKPQLGDIKEKIKFAYTIKHIGNTKILWKNYIEVYEYKMCTIYHTREFGRYKMGTSTFNLPQWKLKEVKLITNK